MFTPRSVPFAALAGLLSGLVVPAAVLAQTAGSSDLPTMYNLQAATPTAFIDVPLHHHGFVPITCLRAVGVVHGNLRQPVETRTPEQIDFTPRRTLTRDEALKIVLRSAAISVDVQQVVTMDPMFGQNFSAMIQQAVQQGIINPVVEEKAFRANDQITRGEFLKIALRANGMRVKTVDQFTDADRAVLPMDVDPMSTLLPEFIGGVSLNIIEPKLATWSELGNVEQLSWLGWDELNNLKKTDTIPLLKPNDAITREEAADLLYRVLSLKRRGFSQAFVSSSTDNLCQDLVAQVVAAPLRP